MLGVADSCPQGGGLQEMYCFRAPQVIPEISELGKDYSNPTCKFQDVSPPHESTNFGLKYFGNATTKSLNNSLM